jgi:hypothetical protein
MIWSLDLIPTLARVKFYFGIEPELFSWRGAFLGVWQRWDAIHYSIVAQSGYSTIESSAFFPLYPLLARYLSFFLGGDVLFGLIIISNLALFF